ncbi:MAG: xanthine dehydrogenase family protein molybdopterin-binding subunit [Acidobacteria bacterium]|nr:xanthine dehydrogenase family protein molybdopterin-binding subunit [Acidobacteriota bacterium]
MTPKMDRREFFITTAAVGGALVIGFGWPRRAEAVDVTTPAAPWYREPSVPEINAWIVVAPDDTVTIRIGQTELGQGVWTACAMMIAEELQCDWSKVRGEYASANRDAREQAPAWTLKNPAGPKPAPTDPRGGGGSGDLPATNERVSWTGVYRRMSTHRSGSVKMNLYFYQLAGAEARERLLLAAAERLGVPASELTAKDSIITHAATGRTVRYGQVAARAAELQHPHPETIRIKSAHEFTLMGTERRNLDVPSKVTGQAVYAIDVKVPGTLHACARACPVWGGDVKRYDFNAIKSMPGVHAVVQFPRPDAGLIRNRQFSGGVAVVADSWWHAKTALDGLPVEWEYPPYTHLDTGNMQRALIDAMKEPGHVIYQRGNVEDAMARAARVVDATYDVPYLARARMEPGNATALVTDDRVDIWIGDQSPQETRFSASQIAGVPQENVYVHTTHLGGGFGRNGNGPQAEHAVMVAKALKGRPVKLQWTREEDWSVGTTYRAMGAAHIRAGLDADGYPIAMDLRAAADSNAAAPERGLTPPAYFVPNLRVSNHFGKFHVPCSTRRATGSPSNVFFVESFIEELAHAAGKDPYEYRRELISRSTIVFEEDWLKALDLVAEMSGWGKPLPEGWARGIAIDDRRNNREEADVCTICAAVCTVSVSKAGAVRLERVDVAFDEGFGFVNPLSVRKQIEGQVAWGWNDAMHQAFTVKDGRMEQNNFHDFPVSRMSEYPREVHIRFFRTNHWLEGVGEEAMSQIPPAIVNAVFRITGKRVRSLPLRKHDLRWA